MLAGPTSSTPSVQFGCSASRVFSDSDAVSTTCSKSCSWHRLPCWVPCCQNVSWHVICLFLSGHVLCSPSNVLYCCSAHPKSSVPATSWLMAIDTILGKHQPSFLFEKLWDRHKLLVVQIGCDRQDMTNRIHNSDTICPHSQLSIALCRLRGFCLSLSCTQKRGTFWCGRAAKDRSCYRRQLVLQTVSRRCGR